MEETNAIAAKPMQWVARLKEGWRDIVSEMKKVTWPSRQEVVSTTFITLVTTVVFAVFLWLCDQGFGQGILWLLKRFGANV